MNKITVIAVIYFIFFKQCLPLRNQVQRCFSNTDVSSLPKIMENVVKKKKNQQKPTHLTLLRGNQTKNAPVP